VLFRALELAIDLPDQLPNCLFALAELSKQFPRTMCRLFRRHGSGFDHLEQLQQLRWVWRPASSCDDSRDWNVQHVSNLCVYPRSGGFAVVTQVVDSTPDATVRHQSGTRLAR
jgi:hypothetical protein